MAQIDVNIHGRQFSMECDDGQQVRVQELGQYVDQKVRQLASSGAGSSDAHLMVLTSIILADEIHELRQTLADLGDHVESKASADQEELIVAQAIDALAERINSIADKVKAA